MKNKLLIYLILCVFNLPLCAQFVSTIDKEINTPWLGFGYNQWAYSRQSDGDSYEPWDEGEWKITEERILAIRPSLVRLPYMLEWFTQTDEGEKLPLGVYNKDGKYMQAFCKSMDLYKKHNIAVMTGFWNCVYSLGHEFYVGSGDDSFARIQADFIDFLINEKGYTNIKYYTPENEPLGAMSDFSLWSQMTKSLHKVMKERGLPDILIGADSWGGWQWFPARDNKNELIGYDFHNYLNNTADDAYKLMYDRTLETFLVNSVQNVHNYDTTKPVMVTELSPTSVSYVDWPVDDAPPHCRLETYEYGLGYWDYGIQLIRSGVSTGLAWGLDGFQWNKNAGMWNNSGNYGGWHLRPWYYTWQLITRYFPADAKMLKMKEPDNGKDVRIAGARIETDDYSFVILNRRKDANSKTQSITIKVPSTQKTCYVYYYNRSSFGDGISLSLPYEKVEISDFSQEGITVEVPVETGVFITTLPPLPKGGKIESDDLVLDFESETGYSLLSDPVSGMASQTNNNPKKQEANMSDKVCQITQILPTDPFRTSGLHSIINPEKSMKITEESPYLAFQCYRNGNNIPSIIAVKLVGKEIIYGSLFTIGSRAWSDVVLDFSDFKGDAIDYIMIYPNLDFVDGADQSTTQYLYVDNIQCISESSTSPLTVTAISTPERNNILKSCNITFEYLSELISISNSNNCVSGEITNNPRTGDENQSEKVMKLLQLGSKRNQEESNDFSVSLNPFYGIQITEKTKHLHFQFFKMKNLSEITVKIEFEGQHEDIIYRVTPDETRKWKTFSIDLSDRVDAIIKNITFFPNVNFFSATTREDEETFIDNIILKSEAHSSIGEEVTNDKIQIFTVNDKVQINGAHGELLRIYTLQGHLIQSGVINSDPFTQTLPKGFYIVKVSSTVKKVIIS